MKFDKRFLASTFWLCAAVIALAFPFASISKAEDATLSGSDSDYLASVTALANGMNLSNLADSTFNAIPVTAQSFQPEASCERIAANAALAEAPVDESGLNRTEIYLAKLTQCSQFM